MLLADISIIMYNQDFIKATWLLWLFIISTIINFN